MAENKTKQNQASVEDFINSVEDEIKRGDCRTIDKLFREISGEEPKMWGASIVGYGTYHYKYESGREGDFMRIGFSPRKQNLTLYIMPGFGKYDDLLSRLGKHKTGKSCLYIKKLADVEMSVLQELARKSLAHMAEKYPSKA